MKRFWDKVDKSGDCWMWTASVRGHGYGAFFYKGKVQRANRVSWELENGPIPSGMVIMHTCDNPLCVNPRHLSAGTQKENVQDSISKGRCHRLKGIGRFDRKEIRDYISQGCKRRDIAAFLGCTTMTVGNAINRQK